MSLQTHEMRNPIPVLRNILYFHRDVTLITERVDDEVRSTRSDSKDRYFLR